MKTYVATRNAGKLKEMREIFAGSMLDLQTFPAYRDVPETANSYVGNALIKAHALTRQLFDAGIEAAVLSDDSGLEVDVLSGRPGVLSARYAGEETTWTKRRQALLGELDGLAEAERTARFVCVMALIVPGHEPLTSIGTVEGRIVSQERGGGGFGYDPLFLYPPSGCTFAELSAEEKNRVSHRRRAADALLATLHTRV